MNSFIKRIIKFIILPVSFLWIVEVCLPLNYFTHRNWEALVIRNSLPRYGPFFPNKTLNSSEQGDLAFNTNLAVYKKVTWKTDNLGFRNEKVEKEPDIIVIGDSFIAGSSLSQDSIFSRQLEREYSNKIKVYNLAPSTFAVWTELLEKGIIRKPKILIFSCVEHTIPEVFKTQNTIPKTIKSKIKENVKQTNLASYTDRFTRFFLLRSLASKIKNSKGEGIPSTSQKEMVFMEGKKIKLQNQKDMYNTAAAILSYKEYCDKIGVKFLFLPMPSKETVYYDLVPLESQPHYINKLTDFLKTKNVSAINTVQEYNKNRKNGILYYHTDDTHWNNSGVGIIAKAVKKEFGDF